MQSSGKSLGVLASAAAALAETENAKVKVILCSLCMRTHDLYPVAVPAESCKYHSLSNDTQAPFSSQITNSKANLIVDMSYAQKTPFHLLVAFEDECVIRNSH